MDSFVLRARPLVLALVAVACASSQKPLVAPEDGGNAWREVTSAHFVLKTDLGESEAKRVSSTLEQTFRGLSEVGFASDATPDVHIDVIHFARMQDYREVGPAMSSAMFSQNGRHDFERRSLIVVGGEYDARVRESVQHELTHMFVRFYYPQAPVWLNEGFAEYLETFSIEDGHATLGKASPYERFWRGPWRAQPDPRGSIILVPVSEAPSASAIVRLKPETFYSRDAVTERSTAEIDAARAQTLNYRGACALVHMLMDAPAYRPAFDEYLKRLRAGEASDAAWASSVGRLPEAELDADFRASLAPRETATLRSDYAPPTLPPVTTRSLEGAEVHVLWARMRDWSRPGAREAAARDLEAARALKPSDVERSLVEAMLATANGSAKDGEAVLRKAAAQYPRDARMWNALGWLLAMHNGTVGEIAPIAEKLRPLATTAAELDLLGHVSVATGDADAALAYEKRAVAVDPNCVECLVTAARAMLTKGLRADAIATATFALGISPEGGSTRDISAFVARMRAGAHGAMTKATTGCRALRRPLFAMELAMQPLSRAPNAPQLDPHVVVLDAIARLRAVAPITGAGHDAAERATVLLERYEADTKATREAACAKDRADGMALLDDVANECGIPTFAVGPLNPQTKSALQAKAGEIAQRCVTAGGHAVEGRIVLDLLIEADGSISSADALGNESGDTAFATCVTEELQALALPPTHGATLLILPLNMRRPSPTP